MLPAQTQLHYKPRQAEDNFRRVFLEWPLPGKVHSVLYELLSLLELPFHHTGLGRGREAREQLCTHSSALQTLSHLLLFLISKYHCGY